jgi:hypothetical protein
LVGVVEYEEFTGPPVSPPPGRLTTGADLVKWEVGRSERAAGNFAK